MSKGLLTISVCIFSPVLYCSTRPINIEDLATGNVVISQIKSNIRNTSQMDNLSKKVWLEIKKL